jgi:hypothetical protein
MFCNVEREKTKEVSLHDDSSLRSTVTAWRI